VRLIEEYNTDSGFGCCIHHPPYMKTYKTSFQKYIIFGTLSFRSKHYVPLHHTQTVKEANVWAEMKRDEVNVT
jgi:hypothetical protein